MLEPDPDNLAGAEMMELGAFVLKNLIRFDLLLYCERSPLRLVTIPCCGLLVRPMD